MSAAPAAIGQPGMGAAAAPAVQAVWRQVAPDLVEELVAFWTQQGALASGEQARQRARQAVLVARDAEGAVCGVATAMLRVLPRLRQPMYYYRQFFAPSLRGQAFAAEFFARARDVLQAWNASQPQPESLGVLLEIENRKLAAAKFGDAVEPFTGAVFIGYSPRGLQLRVSYFDGAKLLAPVIAPGSPARAPRTH
ncbi:MAG TPA: hypothetical protein VM576_01090 [Xanthomonadaceae bacterium]|nr:hypothetical protein [Xanthomonadaceae bacterium]